MCHGQKKGLLYHIWGWSSSHQTIRRELNIYIIRIAIMGWMTYIFFCCAGYHPCMIISHFTTSQMLDDLIVCQVDAQFSHEFPPMLCPVSPPLFIQPTFCRLLLKHLCFQDFSRVFPPKMPLTPDFLEENSRLLTPNFSNHFPWAFQPTWKLIPLSTWLITLVIASPSSGLSHLHIAYSNACWPVTICGVIFQFPFF